ncbi:MAG: rRNA maturation RNase YbeY [Sedimentisphaerales bacterium]|nr:rRNA maturation RNase YbeY [Sedimentisphaerales bacterium]
MTSAKQDQGIIIHLTESFKDVRVPMPTLRKLAHIVCDRFGEKKTPEMTYEVSIVVVDDIRIKELNEQFLKHKRTTDCLSFDLSDGNDSSSRMFELIINGEMAARQADLRGHPSEAELALYITHGLLHNVGFDDATPDQARKMHEAEDKILQQLGYGSVYNKKK